MCFLGRNTKPHRVPGKESEGPEDGPSTTTLAELDALRIFTQTKTVNVPHLLFWKSETQGNDGPLPNGYITYIVMTELSGETLYNLEFWKFTDKEQEDIVARFLPVLQYVYLSCCSSDINTKQIYICSWHKTARSRPTKHYLGQPYKHCVSTNAAWSCSEAKTVIAATSLILNCGKPQLVQI